MRVTFLIACLFAFVGSFAQPSERLYHVAVYPTDGIWQYPVGKKVQFDVSFTRCDVPIGNIEAIYEISEDMMSPLKKGKVKLKNGKASIEAESMKTPGFLRCKVIVNQDGREYVGLATVGFDPDKLLPVTQQPVDFKDFWSNNVTEARKWDLEPTISLMPDFCTSKVNVYHVSFANNAWGSRMYGTLSVPVLPGKYPAILKLPGAGVRGYYGEISHAEKGFIILELGIHGIPVNLDKTVYECLYNGALKGYHSFNIEDKDRFYYKRVITGCVRAIDFIEQLPEYNGCLGTFGGSQGDGLSIIVAGLDKRVKGLVSFYPAMSDMAGYSAGRAGGWPHMLKDERFQTPQILNTLSYYDVSSFAREIDVPGFYTFGYNDMVCPPTTTTSVYNVIDAPKELMVSETTAHYAYTEQWSYAWRWIMDFLKKCSE